MLHIEILQRDFPEAALCKFPADRCFVKEGNSAAFLHQIFHDLNIIDLMQPAEIFYRQVLSLQNALQDLPGTAPFFPDEKRFAQQILCPDFPAVIRRPKPVTGSGYRYVLFS